MDEKKKAKEGMGKEHKKWEMSRKMNEQMQDRKWKRRASKENGENKEEQMKEFMGKGEERKEDKVEGQDKERNNKEEDVRKSRGRWRR